MLPQWHVEVPGHSAESAGDRLHLNTYTSLTQRSRSGLTMPLSRHCVGTYQERIIIVIIFNPLTARVVGAPQMILQSVFSIFSLFSTALWDLANSRPVHSLMLSSHFFLCLPCLLPPFAVPCKMVLARPNERETFHTTAVCVSLRWSVGLRVVRLHAGS